MTTELFVGPIIEKIIDICFEYLKDQLFWQTRTKEALESLKTRLPKIRSVVSAYYRAQIRGQDPDLDRWIWQLRDAIDGADDLLDEFEYLKHKQQLKETKKFLSKSAHKILKVGKRALKIDTNLKRLEEVVQNLDEISDQVSTFLYILESTKQEQQTQQLELYRTRETGSLPSNHLIGRGKGKEFVLQWLRNETHIAPTLYKNISLLSIVGHGGMGKTTLLQHVYEDELTKEFDLKIWVCVSNNFDVKKVISDMLESIKKSRPHLESLHTLQESLKSEVMSKKFLLVLDDIWDDDEQAKNKWENVLAPLACGSLGSKILVTTRMDSVASMIAKVIKNKKETFSLEGLEEDECLQLLNNHAFADVENPDDHKKLKFISGEIVKKLSGSPLAAKVIGGVLSSNIDEEHWRNILTSDFGSGDFIQNGIFPIIRLSYTFLPIPLQTCFAFCSVFPQDYEFDKEDLVRMWIALGFIQPPSTSRENLEDIGGKYFDTLVKKSFFDKFEHRNRYKMHDLLHELTQSISAQECFRVVDDEELLFKIPDTIRHLSVKIKNLDVFRKLGKFKNLRSLFLTYNVHNQDLVDVPTEVFEASRSIRLLYINGKSIKMIPEAIIHLIHLRYLKLHETSITHLPRSISHLYHLQFIIYKAWYGTQIGDDFLPRDINNLSNLHHLNLGMYHEFPAICGIGKLKYLQELEVFYVRNEIGYIIEELKHMNDLRHLKIKFLENVKDAEEACSAKFCDKKNLTNLSLEWGHRESVVPDLDEKLLDNIQPHNNLKNLIINGYMGVRPAIWMNNAHLIHNLECIELEECLEWQNLPPFGQLPFLKSLSLCGMPKVKRLDNKFHGNNIFPSLEALRIYRLEALEDWFDARVTETDDCLFPCLTELYLFHCPNLKELPYFPPKLKILEMDNIGWKTLNFFSISKSISLETLKIRHCPNITFIRLADEIARLAALKRLEIKGCPRLISLGEHQQVKTSENSKLILNELFISDPIMLQMEPLRSVTSLEELTIEENDELVSFSIETEQWFLQLRSSLRKMKFSGLKSLQSLPSSLESLSTLNSLDVSNVPHLQRLPSSLSTISSLEFLILNKIPLLESLPDLPPSLNVLHLEYLDNLNSLPSCISSLSSLNSLRIWSLPQLRELPNLPSTLSYLYIDNCHPEFMERYKKISGSDWHKIAHIPNVHFW